ncbi:MAG TPA: bifunctional acetaldehyde-CoA/alcohol dehydrogenase [Candidatus Dormibacteraeota bacterium]|nr:bifunctional acetaldehyde-CoA/alcohol dehydrogenase [Candidatus Dormibacteraeota bacterium]
MQTVEHIVESISPERASQLDELVARARLAADGLRRLDQAAVDRIVWSMVVAGLEAASDLAQLAVDETGFGVFEDKVVKNYVATEFLYDYLKDKKTVGVIAEDAERRIEYVAEPIGVVVAVTPITNPTSTVLFKSIVAAKTRNAMIFRPSPQAVKCAERVVEILVRAGEAAGMPRGALQVVPDAAREATHYLFRHPGVDFIWATGGPKIVHLANTSGKPTLSVGPGNAPVYLHRSADVRGAVVDILISKTFDDSVICPAEQTCVVDAPIYDQVVEEFERMGARLLTAEEADRLADFAFGREDKVNLMALGQPPHVLGERAGISVAPGTKVLLVPLPTDLDALGRHPLIREKLMPVLGLVRSPDSDHAIAACVLVTEHGGLGHTSAVYATDEAVIRRLAESVRTGRVLVNAPTAVGALGGVYNSLAPTFSLGCGTWGGSATAENVNYRNLLNIKTVSRRQVPPQWFRVPSDTYFNSGSLENLREMKLRQALIVTDPGLEAAGVSEQVRRRLGSALVRIFADVTPEPGETVVRAGVEVLERTRPDAIIAVGGGSVIDAAKVMRLLYEHPELSLDELSLPFLDARKRVAHYPNMAHAVKLIAVPTTAGTGSEVSPAAVLTMESRKATLVDYSLVPDIAIIDPDLTLSLPAGSTADTGIDALTHAIEAVVSIFASPYTDAFCVQAARLIFEALPTAFANGRDLKARTAMSNAATIAGLAFSNAFVGVNHALAHAVGAAFHLPHGRANGIFLPHVIRYNAALPTKFMPAPGYSAYVAREKYAMVGRIIFGGHDDTERVNRLLAQVEALLRTVEIPGTLAEAGVAENDFQAALPSLARAAFADPSLRTNPRMPLLREISELLELGFYGHARSAAPAIGQ